jgi:limonene 1,2-monooxygenase
MNGSSAGLRFACFMSPYHDPRENPTLALHRDVELVQHLDRLGFDEIWIGEHHSTGWELVASPEVFLAYLAGVTSRIKLGTGVVSLPYHHPFQVAERIVLLDQLTHGRAMLGVGPGVLPHDAAMIGLESAQLRPMMEESLHAILALLRGERVTHETNWFTLRDAKVQLPPFRPGEIEVAVTATGSPNGPRLAGRTGASLLSLNAGLTSSLLAQHWDIVEEESTLHGHTADRSTWRLVGPMHIAETEAQARADVEYGLLGWARYMKELVGLPLVPDNADGQSTLDALVDNGFAVVGTPDQAIEQIQRLQEKSGGFGTYLIQANDWARRDATLRSYELFARHVVPAFQPASQSLQDAETYAEKHDLKASYAAAREKVTREYEQERAQRRAGTA